MKEVILKNIRKIIIQSNNSLNNEKLDEIMYGLEGIYLTIEKLIIILIIAFLLNILREVLLFMLLYNIIRFTAFGAHAKSSLVCLCISLITFIFIPALSIKIVLDNIIKLLLWSLAFVIILIYSPADTEKRPIISKKRRLIYKILSSFISIIYLILSYVISNNFIINILIFSLLLEAIMILPITYKLMGVSYNNYKNYEIDG